MNKKIFLISIFLILSAAAGPAGAQSASSPPSIDPCRGQCVAGQTHCQIVRGALGEIRSGYCNPDVINLAATWTCARQQSEINKYPGVYGKQKAPCDAAVGEGYICKDFTESDNFGGTLQQGKCVWHGALPPATTTPPQHFGIGFVPFLNTGDDVEKAMHALVGSFNDVQRIYNPATPDDLFSTLIKLKSFSRPIDLIVIAGHGFGARPYINFSKQGLHPADVDLPFMRKYVQSLERGLAHGSLTALQKRRLAETKARILYLESISDAMAPGAQVLLINCSTVATAAGQQFVRNLGDVLVGKHGGSVVASRSDVSVDQVYSLANKIYVWFKNHEIVPIGEFFTTGDWVRFQIPARVTSS